MAARGDATRDKLLDATIQLVREVGYAQTTTRAVSSVATDAARFATALEPQRRRR